MLILHDHITYGFVLEHTQSQRTLCEHKRLLTHDSPVCVLWQPLFQEQRHTYTNVRILMGLFSPSD